MGERDRDGRTRRGRAGALLCVLVALLAPACAGRADAEPEAPIRPGLYATQWLGYIGAVRGRETHFQLAFVHASGEPANALQLSNVVLLSDRGALPASLDALSTPDADSEGAGPWLRTTFVRLTVEDAGTYRVSRIRFTSPTGDVHTLPIGEWRIEVLELPQVDLLEDLIGGSVAFGPEPFGEVGVELRNTSRRSITVGGIEFAFAGERVRARMLSAGARARPSPRPEEPEIASGPDGVTSGETPTTYPGEAPEVRLPPGPRTAMIYFLLSPESLSGEHPLIQLAPFLRYRVDGERAHRLRPLPLNQYIALEESEESLRRYVRGLPPEAHAPI